LTEQVDTGFDAVLAGERWEAPEDKPAPPPAERPCTHPDYSDWDGSQPEPRPVTATVTNPGLTDAGKQAAKALVKLPVMTPSELAKLAREIAMDIKERTLVFKEYALTETQYEFLEANNDFYKAALHAACIEWHAPLTTQERIKVEAAAILEDSLLGIGARMQNKSEGLPGVIEAAKLFAKVAGVGEREVGLGTPGERFTINIDLGGDQKLVVSSTPAPDKLAQPNIQRAIPEN
jgi:hypothetical protein